MLILTRKSSEALVIADNIEITVLSVDGDRVKLGITAPSDVSVLRKELYLEIRAENRAAASGARAGVASALRSQPLFRSPPE